MWLTQQDTDYLIAQLQTLLAATPIAGVLPSQHSCCVFRGASEYEWAKNVLDYCIASAWTDVPPALEYVFRRLEQADIPVEEIKARILTGSPPILHPPDPPYRTSLLQGWLPFFNRDRVREALEELRCEEADGHALPGLDPSSDALRVCIINSPNGQRRTGRTFVHQYLKYRFALQPQLLRMIYLDYRTVYKYADPASTPQKLLQGLFNGLQKGETVPDVTESPERWRAKAIGKLVRHAFSARKAAEEEHLEGGNAFQAVPLHDFGAGYQGQVLWYIVLDHFDDRDAAGQPEVPTEALELIDTLITFFTQEPADRAIYTGLGLARRDLPLRLVLLGYDTDRLSKLEEKEPNYNPLRVRCEELSTVSLQDVERFVTAFLRHKARLELEPATLNSLAQGIYTSVPPHASDYISQLAQSAQFGVNNLLQVGPAPEN